MKIYDDPRKCPHCGYMINYPDSRMGGRNYCTNCHNQIIYNVSLDETDYLWSKPSAGYGAMDEVIKKQNGGY